MVNAVLQFVRRRSRRRYNEKNKVTLQDYRGVLLFYLCGSNSFIITNNKICYFFLFILINLIILVYFVCALQAFCYGIELRGCVDDGYRVINV